MPHPIGLVTRPQAASGGGAWTPASYGSNLVAWWDFSDTATIHEADATGRISQIDDKSGNGYHLVQATAGNQPATGSRTLNSLNCGDFSTGQNLSVSGLSYPTSSETWTIFGAYNMDAYGNWGSPCSTVTHKNRGNIDFLDMTGSTALSLSTTYRVQFAYNGAIYPSTPRDWLYLNGASDATPGAYGGDYLLTTFRVGGTSDPIYDGRWGELWIVGTAETTADSDADGYLSAKWGSS